LMEYFVAHEEQSACCRVVAQSEPCGNDDSISHCVNRGCKRKEESLLDAQWFVPAVVILGGALCVIVIFQKCGVAAGPEIGPERGGGGDRIRVERVPPPVPHFAREPVPVEQGARTGMATIR
jgi:hypothetical protein